jgi:hypothetical protein
MSQHGEPPFLPLCSILVGSTGFANYYGHGGKKTLQLILGKWDALQLKCQAACTSAEVLAVLCGGRFPSAPQETGTDCACAGGRD